MSLLATDRDLLKRFRSGERAALSRVYREYAPAIAAFLARGFTFSSKGRMLQFSGYHQPFDLDNAVQETFARAFSERARLSYDGLSPFKSYVMAIARNYVLSELRQREVALSQFVREADGETTDAALDRLSTRNPAADEPRAHDGESALLHQELEQLYRSFVEQLRPQHRQFFEHRFEAHLTQVAAGQKSGLSHMQARTLEKRLRMRFLSYMQSRGYLEGHARASGVAMLCLMMGR